MSIGLRTQLSLLALGLLAVPGLGYLNIRSFEQDLLDAQQSAIATLSRSVSNALAGEPALFRAYDTRNPPVAGHDLYAYELSSAPVLDGRADDWDDIAPHALHYAKDRIVEIHRPYHEASLNYDLMTAECGDSLYAFFKVTDDRVVYREVNSISVHRNDNLQIVLGAEGNLKRYTLATVQPGQVEAFRVAPRDQGSRALSPEPRINGYWKATERGYNLEIEIPLDMTGRRLAFAIADVDDQQARDVAVVIGTADTGEPDAAGTLLVPSKPIARALARLGDAGSRMLVLDKYRRVIARTGDIHTAEGIWSGAGADSNGTPAAVFDRLLPAPRTHFTDPLGDASQVKTGAVADAFTGNRRVTLRVAGDGNVDILSAASPITIDGKTDNVLVVEQTTNGITRLSNRAVAGLLTTSLWTIAGGGLLLFLSGWLISRRINGLRRQIEGSIDPQGRVRQLLPGSHAADEIGELSRSIADIVGRLEQYNTYLEDMSGRLAHELRTPVSVVRSSLDNLAMEELPKDAQVYVERANEGVHRLAVILTSMSEASRLEQTLDVSEQEIFDLADVVRGCVQGYEVAWPGQRFTLSVEAEGLRIDGVPDLIAQMLDKLVSNAVEFSQQDAPVKLRLTREQDDAVIRVINDGPPLPAEMQHRLFDSMVSVRAGETRKTSHLGLGLYIARIITAFHGGSVALANREDAEGVIATVRLPIMRLTGRRP